MHNVVYLILFFFTQWIHEIWDSEFVVRSVFKDYESARTSWARTSPAICWDSGLSRLAAQCGCAPTLLHSYWRCHLCQFCVLLCEFAGHPIWSLSPRVCESTCEHVHMHKYADYMSACEWVMTNGVYCVLATSSSGEDMWECEWLVHMCMQPTSSFPSESLTVLLSS